MFDAATVAVGDQLPCACRPRVCEMVLSLCFLVRECSIRLHLRCVRVASVFVNGQQCRFRHIDVMSQPLPQIVDAAYALESYNAMFRCVECSRVYCVLGGGGVACSGVVVDVACAHPLSRGCAAVWRRPTRARANSRWKCRMRRDLPQQSLLLRLRCCSLRQCVVKYRHQRAPLPRTPSSSTTRLCRPTRFPRSSRRYRDHLPTIRTRTPCFVRAAAGA